MPSGNNANSCRRLSQRVRSCRGMTLVEVMVVTAILGVVMAAVYSLMLPVQKSTYTQTQVVDMQDSLRLAMEQMSLDIRHAGLMANGDPIVNLNQNPIPSGRSEFTIRLAARPQILGSRMVSVGGNFQLSPVTSLAIFSEGQRVKILDAVKREVIFPEPAGTAHRVTEVKVHKLGGDDFALDLTLEDGSDPTPKLDQITGEGVRYIVPMIAGEPDVHSITYIFNPNDATVGGVPTLRRYEDWPASTSATSTDPIPNVLPNPLPQNWLLLGGEPGSGGTGKTYAAQFDYDAVTQQVTIDITGATRAYDPNKPDDSLANAKARRLSTTVAIRNAIPTY